MGDWFLAYASAYEVASQGASGLAARHDEELGAMAAAWDRLGRPDVAGLVRRLDARARGHGMTFEEWDGDWDRVAEVLSGIEPALSDVVTTIEVGWFAGLVRAHRADFRGALAP